MANDDEIVISRIDHQAHSASLQKKKLALIILALIKTDLTVVGPNVKTVY